MYWQLHDIGKTMTNDIYPAALAGTQYVSGDTVTLSIGVSRLFPCISVSCRVIPMDTHWFVYSRKQWIQQHEPRGARFKRLFKPNQPSMETTMQTYNYPEMTCGNTNIVFSPGIVWIKNSTIKAC